MKKLLISVLIILLIVLSVFIVINGLEAIGILGYTDIQKQNQELEKSFEEASKLAEVDYKKAVSDVDKAVNSLENTKKEYDELLLINTDENGQTIGILQEYDYENLLVKVGNYATEEDVVMNMSIVESQSNIENSYELHFTVTGSYISIVDFISDIENDSTLGFKIENFEMAEDGENGLQAKFITREIIINDISEITVPEPDEENTEEGSSNNTNNTSNNTSNNTTNSNTSNSSNTSN